MKQLLQNMHNGKIEIRELPITQPGRGMALIRNAFSLVSAGTERLVADFAEKSLVEKAAARPDLVRQIVKKAKRDGILTTVDAALNRLDQPMYPGYSSAGEIVALGEGLSGFQLGERVACGGGNYAVHAEYCTVPRNLIARIPTGVSYEQAAFTTLGAVAMHGFRLASPQINETVLVIGLGLLGLLSAQIATAAGCKTLGVDISESRMLLAQQVGFDACLRENVVSCTAAFTRGRGFDHVLICSGAADNDAIELSAQLCRDRGTIIAVGAVGLNIPRKPFYEKELRFMVSRSYGPGRYDPNYEEKGNDYPLGFVRWTEGRNMEGFLDLLADGKVNVDALITHKIPIAEGGRAYDIIKGKTEEKFLGVLIEYPQPTTAELAPISEPIILRQPAEPQPVSVGVIGAGNYASVTFLPQLKTIKEGVTLKSITSSRGASARNAAEKFGFEKVAVSAEALLQDPEINSVVILTRHNLHAELTAVALQNGKHVYCEKPLALTLDSLRDVFRAVQVAPDRILMVGYNRRFAPLTQQLKTFLAAGSEPIAIHYTVNAGFIAEDHWVQDAEEGGGRILGESCHMIDLMSYLAGSRPISVNALSLPNQGHYRDDNVSLQFHFENGSFGTINYLANGNKNFPKEKLEVFGSGNTAVLIDFKSLETWHGDNHNIFRNSLRTNKGHKESWQAFVKTILQGGQPPIPLDEIFQTSLATLAAIESLKQNDCVQIPGIDILE